MSLDDKYLLLRVSQAERMIDEVVASLKNFDPIKTNSSKPCVPSATKKHIRLKEQKKKLKELSQQPLNTTSNILKKALDESLLISDVNNRKKSFKNSWNHSITYKPSGKTLLDTCSIETDDLSKYVSFSLQKQLQKGYFLKITNKLSKSPGLKTNKKGRKKYERARNYHNRRKNKSQKQNAKKRRMKHFAS